MDRNMDDSTRRVLRNHSNSEAREVRMPLVIWEMVEELARLHRDKYQPRNKGRKPETSWVIANLVFEALSARGLMTMEKDGSLKVVNDIDDLL